MHIFIICNTNSFSSQMPKTKTDTYVNTSMPLWSENLL